MEISQLMAVMKMVEEDRLQALQKLQALKDALACLTGKEKAPCPALTHLREANDVLTRRFARHAADEEKTLFPFLAENLPDEPTLVADLRAEHEKIVRKRKEFADSLTMAQELGNGLSRAIVLDVLTSGWELLDLLDRHVHNETKAAQACFARYVRTLPGM